ncbi:hypothetical protein QQ045_027058 [Rhodiola kirilowii]
MFFSDNINETRRSALLELSKFKEVSFRTLAILPVPKVVLKGIERLMRNFLWDRATSSRHH